MQLLAWASRVSGARGARRAPVTALVRVLVKIALHLQHHEGRCALSLYIYTVGERAARARALGCHCSWFLSRFASLFRHAFRLCRRSAFVPSGASSLRFVSPDLAFCTCLLSLVFRKINIFEDFNHHQMVVFWPPFSAISTHHKLDFSRAHIVETENHELKRKLGEAILIKRERVLSEILHLLIWISIEIILINRQFFLKNLLCNKT